MSAFEDADGGPARERPEAARAERESDGRGERGSGLPPYAPSASGHAIADALDLHRVLVQGVRDYGIFMLDPAGHVASWNEGAERIKGYTADEIVGRHFSAFYAAEDVAARTPHRALETARRDGRFEGEGWRVRKDDSLFWANVVITALRGDDGELLGFAKVTRDLTERRAAQERALDDARRLASAELVNKAKNQFLAAMSHELRTPLNAIGGYAELIEMGIGGPVTDQQREHLIRIRASQQHLLGIITDLLNYSRIEAGQMQYDASPVLLSPAVASVVPLLAPQAASKGLTIASGGADETLAAVGDRVKIEQIVLNLLSNAVKYTPPGGSIVVSCHAAGDTAIVEVRDTGNGIAEVDQSAIFEPFVQLGRSLTSPQEGTGLGLAISRDMARGMRGDVTVQSALGVGSTFRLVLPRMVAGG